MIRRGHMMQKAEAFAKRLINQASRLRETSARIQTEKNLCEARRIEATNRARDWLQSRGLKPPV